MRSTGTVRVRFPKPGELTLQVYTEAPLVYDRQHYTLAARYERETGVWQQRYLSIMLKEGEPKRVDHTEVMQWVIAELRSLVDQVDFLREEPRPGSSLVQPNHSFAGFIDGAPWFTKDHNPDPTSILRTDQHMICPLCRLPYRRHEFSRQLDYDGHPFLTQLCDGRVVKL